MTAVRSYLELLHGGTEGWVFAAAGTPRLGAGGKVEHPDFAETAFAYPRQLDDLEAFLAAASVQQDTWITPGLSANPIRKMDRRKSLPSQYLWCDLDAAGAQDQARAVELAANGGFLVDSGRGPGHLHLYVRLTEPVEAKQLQSLNRRLVAYLHADASPSALNGYLRPPGSLNHKPRVLTGSPATRVKMNGHGEGPGWATINLDKRWGPDRSNGFTAGQEARSEPLPDPLPAGVAVILDDPADANIDRSARLYTLVASCRSSGFTAGQSITAAHHHLPSAAKYGKRLDAEVGRILAKLPGFADDSPPPDPEDPPSGHEGLTATFVSLADVVAEKVSWLWPGRLPLGKLVLLEGDPGVGKSTVSVDLAARTSVGGVMPDGAPLERPAAVIIMSAEDGLADTIKPRLLAAGGDARMVDAFTEVTETDEGVKTTRPPTLPGDLPLLEERIRVTGARLVIVDVLAAYLSGKVDTHKDSDVRRALHQLAAVAERTGACVVCLRHLTKSGGPKAVLRGVGSVGISGQARAVLVVVPYPDPDDDRVVLAVSKCNLAPLAPSLAFRLEPDTFHDCAIAAWGGPVHMTADQLIAASDSQRQPADEDEAKGAKDAAEDFLCQTLATGDRWSADVYRAAKGERIAERTLERAKAELKVTSYRVAGTGGDPDRWYWHLPDEPPDTDV